MTYARLVRLGHGQHPYVMGFYTRHRRFLTLVQSHEMRLERDLTCLSLQRSQ